MDAKKSVVESLMAEALSDMFALRDHVSEGAVAPGQESELAFDADAFASAALDAE